jgi:hypothetical protein
VPEDVAAVEHLHRLEVIRERAWMLLAAAERGQSDHFVPSAEAVGTVAAALADKIREVAAADQPTPAGPASPPLANLWQRLRRHQPAALSVLAEAVAGSDAIERARSGADLAMLHRIVEPVGLAPGEAALDALVRHFAAGGWSARAQRPALDAPGIRRSLAGDGAVALPPALAALLDDAARRQRLEQLAAQLEQAPDWVGIDGRFGSLLDRLVSEAARPPGGNGAVVPQVPAQLLIDRLAPLLDPIVASTVRIGGMLAGDVWRHPLAWANDRSRELVPFHSLLVALAIDLVEPLEEAAAPLADLDQLPVPADRLVAAQMLRLGLVRSRHAAVARLRHPPGSDIVVELRALSVALTERLADRLRAELGRTVHDLPVVRIVEPLAQLAENWREAPGPGIAITTTSF